MLFASGGSPKPPENTFSGGMQDAEGREQEREAPLHERQFAAQTALDVTHYVYNTHTDIYAYTCFSGWHQH